MRPTSRRRLVALHKWLALALSPVLLALVVTGAILSFAPLLDGRARGAMAPPPLDVAALRSLLTRPDVTRDAGSLFVNDDRATVTLRSGRDGHTATFAIASGAPALSPLRRPGAEKGAFFDRVLRIHKNLWGFGGLVTIGAFALGVLVFIGPLLAPPGARRGALGWHRWSGWFLWPLLALAPLSLVLMKFHAPALGGSRSAPMTFVEALDAMGAAHDLRALRVMSHLNDGKTFVVLEPRPDVDLRYVVSRTGINEVDNATVQAGEAIHAGDWGGGWGGMLNLASMLAMLGMLGTGVLSWWRRRGAR